MNTPLISCHLIAPKITPIPHLIFPTVICWYEMGISHLSLRDVVEKSQHRAWFIYRKMIHCRMCLTRQLLMLSPWQQVLSWSTEGMKNNQWWQRNVIWVSLCVESTVVECDREWCELLEASVIQARVFLTCDFCPHLLYIWDVLSTDSG